MRSSYKMSKISYNIMVNKKTKVSKKVTKNKKDKDFERILQELEDPKSIGSGSWALPANATPLEKTKYNICQNILRYQRENNLSDEEIAKRIDLTQAETEDILFCRIPYFTLDRLITYASQIFEPLEVKIIQAKNKTRVFRSNPRISLKSGAKERKNLRV